MSELPKLSYDQLSDIIDHLNNDENYRVPVGNHAVRTLVGMAEKGIEAEKEIASLKSRLEAAEKVVEAARTTLNHLEILDIVEAELILSVDVYDAIKEGGK